MTFARIIAAGAGNAVVLTFVALAACPVVLPAVVWLLRVTLETLSSVGAG
jgi:hypothetical protein